MTDYQDLLRRLKDIKVDLYIANMSAEGQTLHEAVCAIEALLKEREELRKELDDIEAEFELSPKSDE